MIRMSRIGTVARRGAYVMLLMLGAFDCARNGNANGNQATGGSGTGGAGTGGASGTAGAGGDTGVMTSCPVAPPTNGALCSGDLSCSYGSQICCGVSYPSEVATCSNGKFSLGSVETGCQIGGRSCGGAGGGASDGAAGRAAGGGGAGGFVGRSCPANPTPVGFSCSPDEQGGFTGGCYYGSTICCGLSYPTLRVTCQQDAVLQQPVENPCTANPSYSCPTGGSGGMGGVAGAGGGGGGGGVVAVVTSCPVISPYVSSLGLGHCVPPLFCTYGTRSCCGGSMTVPQEEWQCIGDHFEGAVVECPACPDGGAGPGGAAGH